jgi:DNA modification methylase
MTEVKQEKIAKFRPQVANRNRHTQRGTGALEASMRKLGYVAPMTAAASGEIIDGSARLETSAIVFDDDVLVVEHDGLRPIVMVRTDIADANTPEARQIATAANRIAQLNLDWDVEGLLADAQSGLDMTGLFEQSELDAMLAELTPPNVGADTDPQVDKAEELRQKWGVELGQLWQLGPHRLACGDCTDRAVVDRLMGGERAQACITDPPYGTASGSKVQKRGDRIETFDIEWDKEAPIDWIAPMFECLDDGSAVVSFWDNKEITTLWNALKGGGFNTLQTVYWKKTTVPQPRPNFCSSIESSVFARKPGKVLCWNGGGATPNVFDANRAAGNERVAHETQKPLSLFTWLIELVTGQGHIIYEPFAGSGTTLIAAHNLSRRCRAVEISPAYCAVILQRFLNHTGIEPELLAA